MPVIGRTARPHCGELRSAATWKRFSWMLRYTIRHSIQFNSQEYGRAGQGRRVPRPHNQRGDGMGALSAGLRLGPRQSSLLVLLRSMGTNSRARLGGEMLKRALYFFPAARAPDLAHGHLGVAIYTTHLHASRQEPASGTLTGLTPRHLAGVRRSLSVACQHPYCYCC